MEADVCCRYLAAHTTLVLSLSKDGRTRIAVVRQAHHWGGVPLRLAKPIRAFHLRAELVEGRPRAHWFDSS